MLLQNPYLHNGRALHMGISVCITAIYTIPITNKMVGSVLSLDSLLASTCFLTTCLEAIFSFSSILFHFRHQPCRGWMFWITISLWFYKHYVKFRVSKGSIVLGIKWYTYLCVPYKPKYRLIPDVSACTVISANTRKLSYFFFL